MSDEQDQGSEEQQQEPQGEGQGGTEPQGEPKFDAAYVKQLRAEAAGHRKRAAEAEAKLKAKEEADLSETEKKDKRLKELETELETLRRTTRLAEVRAAAASAGAVDAGDVARLVDDETEDVEKAILLLKKQKPYLFTRPGAGSADGGAGGSAKGGGMNDLIRGAFGR